MILASNNAHKLDEFRAIFADMGIEIIPQSAAGCDFEVDETGETFEENAYLKAIAVTRATGQAAIADDSGLEVDALGGAPGVHSARYTGRARRYGRRTQRAPAAQPRRTYRPHGAVRVVHLLHIPERRRARARGTCEGSILFAPGAGKTASAMTRCSCRMATTVPWRSCARKRKTPFPTAEMRSKS